MREKVTIAIVFILTFNISLDAQVLEYIGKVEKLKSGINSQYDEVTPILSKDGKTLYFTRIAHPEFDNTLIHQGQLVTDMMTDVEMEALLRDVYTMIAGRYIAEPVKSRYNQDIWVASLDDDGNPKKISHPGYPLNSVYPNSVLAYDKKRDHLVVINEFEKNGAVYEGISSVKENGGDYSFPAPIKVFGFYTKDDEVNLSINAEGTVMIIALNRGDNGFSRDLYLSRLMGSKYWSEPVNLGSDINTQYRESTPFIAENGKRLFFTSDRPGGYGGVDIYYSDRLDESWHSWSEPQLLSEPINSEDNDSQPCFIEGKEYLYFTSDREGESNIYIFRRKTPKYFEKNKFLELSVVDSLSKKPLKAEVRYGYKDRIRGQELSNFYRSNTGKMQVKLDSDLGLEFEVESGGYHTKTVHWALPKDADSSVLEHKHTIAMLPKDQKLIEPKAPREKNVVEKEEIAKVEPIETVDETEVVSEISTKNNTALKNQIHLKSTEIDGQKFLIERSYVLKKIYFVRSKATVRRSSKPALLKLYNKIKGSNPEVHIMISGHTDNQGSEKHLIALSKKRADFIKHYLIKKGIDAERIHTVGMGSSKPLNDNSSERLKMQNRRVEISILRKDMGGSESSSLNNTSEFGRAE